MINEYSEILDKFRNRPNVLKDAKARSKDLVKNLKITQICLEIMELEQIKLFGDPLAKFEELDTIEKTLDAKLQAHKQRLKAMGDPFADLL